MKKVHCHQGLDQYTGRLNAAQIAAGMNAAEENAARLLADAELLLNAGRYPTACSLATLCIEEAGKISTLRRIATCNDDAERREVWKEYRSHQSKSRHAIIRRVFAHHACPPDELSGAAASWTERSGTIDMLKQRGFYTDCVGDVTWSKPDSIIERQLAEQLIGIALIMSVGRGYRHTVKEIELWIAHMGPVMDKPYAWIKTALINWHRAMADHGLDGGPNAQLVRELREEAPRPTHFEPT
jgi:AbiV family abortive infection protein